MFESSWAGHVRWRNRRLGAFRSLCERLDPAGTFRNRWLRTTIFADR